MNVRFQGRPITHEARRTDSTGGTTWCRVTFYWDGVLLGEPSYPHAERAPEDAECDCMACIARLEPNIGFSSYVRSGVAMMNVKAISKLEFVSAGKDKE